MPEYLFRNSKTGEVKAIFQHIDDDHSSFNKGDIKFERVFTVPYAQVDSTNKIDPFDSKAFVKKTGNQKGNLDDLWSQSQELSEKRAQKAGIDTVKEQYYSDYSAKRHGKKHQDVIKKELKEKFKNNPIISLE